jgi:hypothetical protein
VYNPQHVKPSGANLAPHAVGTAEVKMGKSEGYSVAITQHSGVGYTLASDLDPEQSASLVAVVNGSN